RLGVEVVPLAAARRARAQRHLDALAPVRVHAGRDGYQPVRLGPQRLGQVVGVALEPAGGDHHRGRVDDGPLATVLDGQAGDRAGVVTYQVDGGGLVPDLDTEPVGRLEQDAPQRLAPADGLQPRP